MLSNGFEGWYFKHQRGGDTVAFIPGRAESGAFVQMITADGSRRFDVTELEVDDGIIRADKCFFSRRGCRIDLPDVSGEITYGPVTELGGDIMGPFALLPMECRHGVISMSHDLRGSLSIGGAEHVFDGGTGYIEKDSGTSFPRSYLWLQCNDFDIPLSVMVSVAHIPFFGKSFAGCICAVILGGREYRLATYNGVHIIAADERHICLSQGALMLEININRSGGGHALLSPVLGKMSGTIRESTDVPVRVRLWRRGELIADRHSSHAAFEYVADKKQCPKS